MTVDPITLALVTGVAEGAAGVVTDAVLKGVAKAYNTLKYAIIKKRGADSDVVEAVENLEKRPDSKPRKDVLAEEVAAARLSEDPEIVQLAEALRTALEKTDTGKAAVSKHIEIYGGEVGVIGDHAKIEGGIHFGSKK